MKRAVYIAAIFSFAIFHFSISQAQNNYPGQVPPPQRYTVSFESQHGEAFSVFVDGDLKNRIPQGRVIVNDMGGQTHEVVVVLKRPVEKAAVMKLRPSEPTVTVNVNYDMRLEQLYLYTPGHNRGDDGGLANYRRRDEAETNPSSPAGKQPTENLTADDAKAASEDDVLSMIERMKALSFDSDRLALGKTLVAATPMTAAQIARLAESIDFSNSQVEFLKYAFAYCIDKVNYYRTVDVLTFSSDKRKVLDYIATQQ